MKPKWHKEDDGSETFAATDDSPPHAHVYHVRPGVWGFEVYLFSGHKVTGASKTRAAAKAWALVYLTVEEKIKRQKAVVGRCQ